jgi:hypothetical protein
MTEGATVTLADNIAKARLVIGTQEYLNGVTPPVPTRYFLDQNSPNPFNPITRIRFGLPKPGKVRLDVLNILGQTVTTLIDRELNAGYHTVEWNGDDADGHGVASGIYFYRLRAAGYSASRKMVLLK